MLWFTAGDPLSINIEAFLSTVAPLATRRTAVVGIGSFAQLKWQADALSLDAPKIQMLKELPHGPLPAGVYWFNIEVSAQDPRTLSAEARGRIAYEALLTLKSVPWHTYKRSAVLTAPVDKKNCVLAGFNFPGQTEFFEDLWQEKAVMMLAGPKLKVALATQHLALKDVPSTITSPQLISRCKIVCHELTHIFKIAKPRLAVCGLNPHAGDGGLFGDEEEKIIAPAVSELRNQGFDVFGPLPADTVFYQAYHQKFDAVMAMYHDQGLGPLKLAHFDEAVNVSLGLPHLRVSPDHGPAADLFLTKKAHMTSFSHATDLCLEYLGV